MLWLEDGYSRRSFKKNECKSYRKETGHLPAGFVATGAPIKVLIIPLGAPKGSPWEEEKLVSTQSHFFRIHEKNGVLHSIFKIFLIIKYN